MGADPNQLSWLTPRRSGEKRVVFFDLETLRSADEVGGWSNIHKMGCAVAVCYDTLDQQYYVYEESDINFLIEKLLTADLVVGFNHMRFDYRVLQAYTQIKLYQLPNFDILEDVTKVLGHRLSLNALASITLKKKKSADGLQSLAWIKEGRLDLVKEYCQMDVEVTRDLFMFGASKGYVLYEKDQKQQPIYVSWALPHIFDELDRGK